MFLKGTEEFELEVLAGDVSIAFAYHMFSDIYNSASILFNGVEAALIQPTKDDCDLRVYASLIEQFKMLQTHLAPHRKNLQLAYTQALNRQLMLADLDRIHTVDEHHLLRKSAEEHKR